MSILLAEKKSAQNRLQIDEAMIHQASMDLSYTVIKAPIDGMIDHLDIQKGNYLSVVKPVIVILPINQLWIQSNYLEKDLHHMWAGQSVTIHVDAYNLDLNGIVDSVIPVSNITFSPFASENTTGNFTKIIQRIPVKITLSPNRKGLKLLKIGLSVETRVFLSRKTG